MMEDMDMSGDEGPAHRLEEYVKYTRSGLKLHVYSDQNQRKRPAVLYGEIPNVPSGTIATSRNELRKLLIHTAYTVHYCIRNEGIVSILLDNKLHFTDEGTDILLHGYKGPDAQKKNASLHKGFLLNISSGKPIRVIRSHDSTSVHRPLRGYRYDGLYSVKLLTLNGLTNYCLTWIKTPNENIPPELISSTRMVKNTLLMVKAMYLKENEPIDVKTEMLETTEYNSMLERMKSESTDEFEEMNESLDQFDDENDRVEFNNERYVNEFDEYHNPEFEQNNSSTELVEDTKNNICDYGNQSEDSENPDNNMNLKSEPGEEIGDNDEQFPNSDTDSGVDVNEDTMRNINGTHESNQAVRGFPPRDSVVSGNESNQMTQDKAKGGLLKKFSNENVSCNDSRSNQFLSHKCLYSLTVAEFLELVSTTNNSNQCCPCSQPSSERRITERDISCLQSFIEQFNPRAKTAFQCLVDDFRKRINAVRTKNNYIEKEVRKGCLRGRTSTKPKKLCNTCMNKVLMKRKKLRYSSCPYGERRKEHPLLVKGPLIIPEDEEDGDFYGFED